MSFNNILSLFSFNLKTFYVSGQYHFNRDEAKTADICNAMTRALKAYKDTPTSISILHEDKRYLVLNTKQGFTIHLYSRVYNLYSAGCNSLPGFNNDLESGNQNIVIIFVCAADSNYPRTVINSFLNEVGESFIPFIKQHVSAEYITKSSSLTFGNTPNLQGCFDKKFIKIIMPIYERYNNPSTSGNKAANLLNEANMTRDIVAANVDRLVVQNKKINDVHEDAIDLAENAGAFRKAAKDVEKSARCLSTKMTIVIVVICVVIVAAIVIGLCVKYCK